MSTSKNTHSARAMLELRRRILEGELAGGTRLLEVNLADDLGISRTPLRQAMSHLAIEGLLERSPSGGFQVRAFERQDVIDTIDLRGLLEGMAARRAAERGIPVSAQSHLNTLLDALDACFGGSFHDIDFNEYSTLNEQFHRKIVEAADSAVLAREIERVNNLPFASPSAFVRLGDDIERFNRSLVIAQDQHRELVDALIAREGARAETIAREHARHARRNFELMSAQGSSATAMRPELAMVTG